MPVGNLLEHVLFALISGDLESLGIQTTY
jgi:hypothetical protein